MVKKALLVGINYYSVSGCKLNGCVDDIINMKNNLITNYGYTDNDIVMLRDDSTAYTQPTAQNIVNWLYALIQISAKCEEVWFHYSGHGSTIPDLNRDEQSGRDSVIIPVDFQKVGVITDDLLLGIVKKSKCRTMLLFDSCNSGSICDLKWSYEWAKGNTFSRAQQNTVGVSNNPNIYCISGCKDTQTSADVYDTDQKEYVGAFTDAFLHALAKNNYSGSLLSIYRDTCIYLANKGYGQKPLLSSTSSTPSYTLQKTIAKTKLLLGARGGFSAYTPLIEGRATIREVDLSAPAPFSIKRVAAAAAFARGARAFKKPLVYL
jgi:hypothetical protein